MGNKREATSAPATPAQPRSEKANSVQKKKDSKKGEESLGAESENEKHKAAATDDQETPGGQSAKKKDSGKKGAGKANGSAKSAGPDAGGDKKNMMDVDGGGKANKDAGQDAGKSRGKKKHSEGKHEGKGGGGAAKSGEDSVESKLKADWTPSKVLYSADGKLLLGACGGTTVEVLSVSGGMMLFELQDHKAAVTDIVLHPVKDTQVFTSSLDGSIRLWDLTRGELVKAWKCGYPIRHLLLSPDGTKAYASSLKAIPGGHDGDGKPTEAQVVGAVYEIVLDTTKQRRLFKCRNIARLAMSSDGVLAAVSGREVIVWRENYREPGMCLPDVCVYMCMYMYMDICVYSHRKTLRSAYYVPCICMYTSTQAGICAT
jgi:hypothetical protein